MTKKKISAGAIAGIVIGGGLLFWLLLSSLGLVHNFLGWDAKHSSGWWKVVEFVCIAVLALWIYFIVKGKIELDRGPIIFAGVLFVLAVQAGTGFKSTAGDIGQRISAFKSDGSFEASDPDDNELTGKEIIFEYYSGFYHLDTDTALVNYINTYNEFPGVNDFNPYRRNWLRGDTANGFPPSTAPRANEQGFKLHSHWDNKIAKRGNK